MKVLIIEDDHIASELLKILIETSFKRLFSTIETSETYEDSLEKIIASKPDLVFLDLNLKGKDAFDLLKLKSTHSFETVIITADDKKAYQAIKHQVLDYLIKPITIDDLSDSIQKFVLKRIENPPSCSRTKIKLANPNGFFLIEHDEIVFCEACGNHSKIFFSKGHCSLISKPLIELEKQLSYYKFFRIHKSYLINLNHIIEYNKSNGGYVIMKHYEKIKVPISRNRRLALFNLI